MHDLLVVALGSPLLIGVYDAEGRRVESIESQEKSSDALPEICAELLERYAFRGLYYAKGPGSFMSIKIAYIFLRTLSITREIPMFAADAFYFNANAPVKAVGKLCFVKNSNGIETRLFEEVPPQRFTLPERLNPEDFETDTAPYYGIGAVG